MSDWLDAEQHVERAHELYDAGRWDEAENELRRALSLNPYQSEWYFNLGLTLEAAGRYVDAADAFERCAKLQQESGNADANAMILAGVNLIRAQRPKDALPWLDEAERLEPMNVAIVVHRIEAMTDLDRFADAEEAFYLGQQSDPEYPELYLAMGEALQKNEQHERAVWCLREAARLDPTLPRVRAHLADAYARLGRTERARQLYIQELRVDPGDTDTLLDLGDLLVDMNRFEDAAEKYRRVLELAPSNADAHFALGDLALQTEDLAQALVHFDVVLRLDKSYPNVRTRLATVLLDRGNEEDTPRIRELLTQEFMGIKKTDDENEIRATEPSSPDSELLEDLGHSLIRAGMLHRARTVFERLIESTPSSYRAWQGLSVSCLESGEITLGIDAAKRSLELRPSFVPAMHNLVLAYYRQGQYIRAKYWLRHAMRHDADDPALRRLRLRLTARSALSIGSWVIGRFDRVLRIALWPVLRPARRAR